MVKNEPEPSDPLEIHGVGVPDPTGESTRLMAECFAEEFLRLGRTPDEVLELFRSPAYALPHRAWQELGEDAVRGIALEMDRIWSQARRASAGRTR